MCFNIEIMIAMSIRVRISLHTSTLWNDALLGLGPVNFIAEYRNSEQRYYWNKSKVTQRDFICHINICRNKDTFLQWSGREWRLTRWIQTNCYYSKCHIYLYQPTVNCEPYFFKIKSVLRTFFTFFCSRVEKRRKKTESKTKWRVNWEKLQSNGTFKSWKRIFFLSNQEWNLKF